MCIKTRDAGKTRHLAVIILLIAVIAFDAGFAFASGTSGFKARDTRNNVLPGTCSFTIKNLSTKAASIVLAIQKKSNSGDTLSYWSPGTRSSIRNYLRPNTPKDAIKYMTHTFFVVKGYKDSIGNVVMTIDANDTPKSIYRYVAMVAVISGNSVSWNVLKATPSGGSYRVTLSKNLCTKLTKDGVSCLIVIIGEDHIWW